jgi:hypothetical protein
MFYFGLFGHLKLYQIAQPPHLRDAGTVVLEQDRSFAEINVVNRAVA